MVTAVETAVAMVVALEEETAAAMAVGFGLTVLTLATSAISSPVRTFVARSGGMLSLLQALRA